jgi:peptidoglycan/LPS O-acetylase OafA/YrhL
VQHFDDFPFHFVLGQHGVQLFFCISGFVIFWTLERSDTIADFAFSRFTRLFPSYWTALAVAGVVSVTLFEVPFSPALYLVNATMLQRFLGFPDLDAVFWTLAVELVFYVWMAVLSAARLLHRMVWVSGIWLALSAASSMARAWVEVPGWLNTYLILSDIPFFLAGTMFYLIRKHGLRSEYLAIILLAWIAAGLVGGNGPGVLDTGAVFAGFSIALTGRLRVLVNPVTMWLGAISYALYLIHRNMGYEVLAALNRLGVPSTVSVPLAMLGALGLASAITYGVERPAMAALREWYKRRKTRTAATPSG